MEEIYAALLLHKQGQTVNEENLKKILVVSGKQVDESKIKVLVASLKGVDIDKELEQAAVVSAPTVEAKADTEKDKKKEEKKEEAAEGLSALFG